MIFYDIHSLGTLIPCFPSIGRCQDLYYFADLIIRTWCSASLYSLDLTTYVTPRDSTSLGAKACCTNVWRSLPPPVVLQ